MLKRQEQKAVSLQLPFGVAALVDCDLNLPLYRIAVGAKAATDILVVSPSGLPLRLGALPFALTALAVKQTDSGATKLHRPFAERRAKHVAP
ncbi:MAG: hypothetical protein FWH31_01105 [Streptococcaceae bacterium]|nr:hypothetical protein [Streptococcaceae bacterium]